MQIIKKPLNIFVHRASECLTDHEAHGEGLICFSLLKGLVDRGHRIFAYTNRVAVRDMPQGLIVRSGQHRVPANSLAPWEHSWRASRWLRQLMQEQPIDLVWHMNPAGGGGCPRPPQTFGKPLVVGPLYYGWPDTPGVKPTTGRPRLGIGLQSLIGPLAERGWQQTLEQSAALFCATQPHADAMQARLPQVHVSDLPLIVEPPQGIEPRASRAEDKAITLLFVANLVSYKNPRVFCETVQRLRAAGIEARGIILGDGPERKALEAWSAEVGMKFALCFKGKVPNSEVYREMTGADFLVSLSQGEPYGRGIAEAMAVGTPAICHRSGGPADFIEDGQDGLLVNELTAAAYADRIERARVAPGAWERLSAGAARKAQDWRSEVVLTQLEESLYQAVQLGGKGRA